MDSTTRANRAKQLLDDPLLIELLDSIEADAIDAWRRSGTPEDRERAWHALKASERVRDCLKGVVDNGLIASRRVAGR